MITNARGKVLCVHTSGKRNFMDPSFTKNEAVMKAKGWSLVLEPMSPPAIASEIKQQIPGSRNVEKTSKSAAASKEPTEIRPKSIVGSPDGEVKIAEDSAVDASELMNEKGR